MAGAHEKGELEVAENLERFSKAFAAREKSPNELFDELQEIALELIAENKELCVKLKAAYGRLLGTLEKKDPLRATIQEKLQSLSQRVREIKQEEGMVNAGKEEVSYDSETMGLDARLFDTSIIPEKESEVFLLAFKQAPAELQQKYRKELPSRVFKQKDEVSTITALRGAAFELSRYGKVVQQGLEQVADHRDLTVTVDYIGYEKKATDFAESPSRKVLKSPIDFDVPIIRDGRPYVYETKAYSRKRYGADGTGEQVRNQMLHYEAAVQQGAVSGATVELKGRLDLEFLFWAMGSSIADHGHAPHVEIIYTIDLPSGNEYRFVLKRAEGKEGLRFKNEFSYTKEQESLKREDFEIIAGIQASLVDKSITRLISDTGGLINPEQASPALRPFLENPSAITDKQLYAEYDQLRTNALLQRLRQKHAELRVNKENKKSAVSEFATREYVFQTVQALQDELAQNPEKAQLKAGYILSREKVDLVVDKTMAIIDGIAAYERDRDFDPNEIERQKERARLGYRGRTEGISLDIEHIILDAIKDVNKEGIDRSKIKDQKILKTFFKNPEEEKLFFKDQWTTEEELLSDELYKSVKPKDQELVLRLYREAQFTRSYDKPERFQKIEDIPAYLETQDRRYQELRYLDPKTGETIRLANTSDEQIQKTENMIVKENCKRAQEHIKETSIKKNGREVQFKREITRITLKIEELEKNKDATLNEKRAQAQKASPEEKPRLFAELQRISAELNQEIIALYRSLETVYQKIVPASEWKAFAQRITERIDQNVIKFIYVVTAEGDIILQEEVLRGLVSGRAAHSELGRGRNCYGAGEIAFTKNDEGKWELSEINNGSGHYRPDASRTLQYIHKLIEKKGIAINQEVLATNTLLIDSILRGMPLREADLF